MIRAVTRDWFARTGRFSFDFGGSLIRYGVRECGMARLQVLGLVDRRGALRSIEIGLQKRHAAWESGW